MPTIRPYNRTFLRGLQTTRPSDGADDFTGFRRFQNVRTHRDEAEIRPGRALLQSLPGVQTAAVFDGASEGVAQNKAIIWSVGMPRWTCDGLIEPTLIVESEILVQGGITVRLNALGQIEALVDDGAVRTLTSTSTISAGDRVLWSVERDGESLVLLIEGVLDASLVLGDDCVESESSDLLLGSLFSGSVDFVRFREGLPGHRRGTRTRLLGPRSRNVRACYRDGPDDDGLIIDHSINEMHARTTAGVVAGPSLSHVHNPVQVMRAFIDDDGSRKLFVVAGGREFGGAV